MGGWVAGLAVVCAVRVGPVCLAMIWAAWLLVLCLRMGNPRRDWFGVRAAGSVVDRADRWACVCRFSPPRWGSHIGWWWTTGALIGMLGARGTTWVCIGFYAHKCDWRRSFQGGGDCIDASSDMVGRDFLIHFRSPDRHNSQPISDTPNRTRP